SVAVGGLGLGQDLLGLGLVDEGGLHRGGDGVGLVHGGGGAGRAHHLAGLGELAVGGVGGAGGEVGGSALGDDRLGPLLGRGGAAEEAAGNLGREDEDGTDAAEDDGQGQPEAATGAAGG